MDTKTEQHELISALADGQLTGEAFDLAVRAATGDSEARAAWHAYHVVGDVLRSADLAACTPPDRFLAGLRERLQGEPPLAAPLRVGEAANDSSFRWKVAAGFASFAAVAAIGWNIAAVTAQPAAQFAAAPPAAAPLAVTTSVQGAMIRDPHLDRLLAAHRQLGGTALQTPAGFLRNATFEGPAR